MLSTMIVGFIHFLVLLSCFISQAIFTFLFVFFWKKYNSPVIKKYFPLLICSICLELLLLTHYLGLQPAQAGTTTLFFLVMCCFMCIVVSAPIAFDALFPSKYGPAIIKLSIPTFGLNALAIGCAFYPVWFRGGTVSLLPFWGAAACFILISVLLILNMIGVGFHHENLLVRRVLRLFVVLTPLFVVGWLYDFCTFYRFLTAPESAPYYGVVFLFLLVWNSEFIIHAFRFLLLRESFPLFIRPNLNLMDQVGLTKREKEVVLLVLNGLPNKQIAEQLYVEESTVKRHIQNIFRKMNLDNRYELMETFYTFAR